MSESVEMYLKTILELRVDESEPVPISAVAKRLGVSTVSANEMIKRLIEQGTVSHTLYKGVELTDAGYRRAMAVVRRHRLWEHFLVEHLKIDWANAHDLACQLEHATSDEVTGALAAYLGQPAACPHGNLIPDPEGACQTPADIPLYAMEVGQSGVISRIFPEETPMLAYLFERGVRPGQAAVLREIAPYNGPITLQLGSRQVVLGRTVAQHVFVRLDGPAG